MSTITLSGISLPSALVWAERHQPRTITGRQRTTLGGRPVVFVGERSWWPITLEARPGVCWLTTAQVEAIAPLAEVGDALYTLELLGATRQVRFRHWDGAFEVDELWPNAGRWTGAIRLMEVA